MNIWIIDHYSVPVKYYPLARNTNFAKNFMKMGHQVTIFAASTVHNSDVNLIEDGRKYIEVIDDGIRYVLIKCHQYEGNGIKRIINMLEFAKKLSFVCSRFEQPDAILSTSMTLFACAKGLRLSKRYGCKKIAQITDLWPESIVAYGIASKFNPAIVIMRSIEKGIYKNADDIIFSMEGAYEYIIDQGWERDIPRSKVHFINNGIDLAQVQRNMKLYTLSNPDLENRDTFKVVYTGSIRRVNNVSAILDIAKYTENKNVRFLIWGKGDDVDYIQQRIKNEKIENVIYEGFVDKKYIPYITSKCDLGIMHIENVSVVKYGLSLNKMFDYLAAGLPVLTDVNTDYNPSVNEGAGFAVSSFSPKQLAQAIDNCAQMSGDEYQIYKDCAFKAAEKYDFKNLTNHLAKIMSNRE